MTTLAVTQIATIKTLIDTLADLDISPLHLHIDTSHMGADTTPRVSMWMQTRTDFEAVCERLGMKTKEHRWSQSGQREWSAEHDTPERRLLVQVVSFAHHDDWQPKPDPRPTPTTEESTT